LFPAGSWHSDGCHKAHPSRARNAFSHSISRLIQRADAALVEKARAAAAKRQAERQAAVDAAAARLTTP